jgi:MFS family permease
MTQNRINKRIRHIFEEFPAKFWVVVAASFVDRVGGTMIFPFFALYITQKFNIGMTQAGVLLGVFSFAGFAGNLLGGGLADRFGRKVMVLFGLVFSALSAVSMGLVNELWVFYVLAILVGLLSDVAGPAWQAMVADILPEEKRTEGFGVLRVVANLAWIVGPTIGGLMASRSYLLLFVMDAICSLITAAIIFRLIPETKPQREEAGEKQESLLRTMSGYGKVITDRLYMAYIAASMLMLVVYIQMYNSLSVFLRDVHGITPQQYGFLLTSSAITVVICQFWVSRRVKNYPPMLMMALGSAFYVVGFSMFGFVGAYILFISAIVLITVGEMIVMPVSQALAANFAPIDMRGRYMAIFSLAWTVPAMVGPTLAGLILDNYNPNWVWYAGGIICTLAVVSFLYLHQATRGRLVSESRDELAPAD